MELYHCTAPNGCIYADGCGSALGCYHCAWFEEIDLDNPESSEETKE